MITYENFKWDGLLAVVVAFSLYNSLNGMSELPLPFKGLQEEGRGWCWKSKGGNAADNEQQMADARAQRKPDEQQRPVAQQHLVDNPFMRAYHARALAAAAFPCRKATRADPPA
jgi:hypothetical protein